MNRKETAFIWFWTRWAGKKQRLFGFERGDQERNSIIVVWKEVSRKETTLIWFWKRWAGKKHHYYGFERGEKERNNILMVLKEVSRKETSFIWFWMRWAGKKQHSLWFWKRWAGRNYIIRSIWALLRCEQGRNSMFTFRNWRGCKGRTGLKWRGWKQ